MIDRKSSTLGKQLSFHPMIPRGRLLRWLILAAAGAMAIVGGWRWYTGYTQFGVAAGTGWSRPWLAASGLLIVAVLIDAFRRRQLARRFAAVYKNGLKAHLPGLKNQTLRWQDIAGVTVDSSQASLLGMNFSRELRLVVTSNMNGVARLGSELDNLPALIENLKREYYAFLTPRLEADFKANKWLYFGPVSLNQQTLQVRGLKTPIEEIDQIAVKSGTLHIERRGRKPLKVRTDRIPNLELLLKMIDSL